VTLPMLRGDKWGQQT